MGPFNHFGLQALLQKEYQPDFTAQVINFAKVLRIKKIDYLGALTKMENY